MRSVISQAPILLPLDKGETMVSDLMLPMERKIMQYMGQSGLPQGSAMLDTLMVT